jgi:hypothetical protein
MSENNLMFIHNRKLVLGPAAWLLTYNSPSYMVSAVTSPLHLNMKKLPSESWPEI